jgi:acetate kinase
MGLTPIEGMLMAERSGSVDPGLLLAVMRQDNLTPDDLERMLNHESGLKGLTGGRTGDINEVHRLSESGDPNARRAIAVYVHKACREIAAVCAALKRLDALAFPEAQLQTLRGCAQQSLRAWVFSVWNWTRTAIRELTLMIATSQLMHRVQGS